MIPTKRFLTASLLAVSALSAALAADVSSDIASRFGRDYLDRIAPGHSVRNVEIKTDDYYIINYYPQGWAVIAADDRSEPLIGYSTTGSIQWHSLPDNMRFMLGEYGRAVEARRVGGALPAAGWNISNSSVSRAEGNVVEPLITVHWSQESPYNKYCPKSGGRSALVGCVALAMSQAMSVQRYPGSPSGQVDYSCPGFGDLRIDFDFERAYNWNNILSGAGNFDEAARLMYHAGMSVFMGYGFDGSGIPSNQIYRISDALVENFGYNENVVKYYYRDNTSNWERIIQNELLAGRAVIYNAIDPEIGGHSFNVDGIDNAGLYHFNWGWGGHGDGYFTMNALVVQGYDFSTGHRIVVGIGNPGRNLLTLDLSEETIEENLPAGSTIGAVTVNGEIPGAGIELKISDPDGNEPGSEYFPFLLDGNQVKTTRSLTAGGRNYNLVIEAIHKESGESMRQGFVIRVVKTQGLLESTSVEYNRPLGRFTIRTKHNVSYTLRDASGQTLSTGSLAPLPVLTLTRDQLGAGTNTLTLTSANEEKTIRIVNSK
ncbi:MAG: C10 family peptidase [Clostridium sp.]|nr:C10 family peptidase [Clostridium sp.]